MKGNGLWVFVGKGESAGALTQSDHQQELILMGKFQLLRWLREKGGS